MPSTTHEETALFYRPPLSPPPPLLVPYTSDIEPPSPLPPPTLLLLLRLATAASASSMPAGSFMLLHVPLVELAEGDTHETKPKLLCLESPPVPLHHNSWLQMRAHLASDAPSLLQPAESLVLLQAPLLELAEGDTHETNPRELSFHSGLIFFLWSAVPSTPPNSDHPCRTLL